jgi:hypothetical protein
MIGDALPLLAVVALVAVASALWRRRSGHVRLTDDRLDGDDWADLGGIGAPGDAPFLLLFTAPGCATCGPARRVLDAVSGQTRAPVIALDVTEHEHIAHAHRVMRAPTTFVVAAGGRVSARVTGIPHGDELVALLRPPPPGRPAQSASPTAESTAA